MILVGEDYYFQNANTGFDQVEKIVNIGNRF